MSAPNNNNMNENSGMAGTGLNEPNVHGANAPVGTHPHQGCDTALAAGAAGLAGHEYGKHTGQDSHHYGADAAVGAGVLDHEHHKHQNRNAAVGDDTNDKPSVGEKIKGNLEKATGKVTGNEAKIIEGDQLAHGNRVL